MESLPTPIRSYRLTYIVAMGGQFGWREDSVVIRAYTAADAIAQFWLGRVEDLHRLRRIEPEETQ